MRIDVRSVSGVVAATLWALSVVSAHALPFNDDMVNYQKRTGSIMRPRVSGTVSKDFAAPRPATKEEAMKLKNPVKADSVSVETGERLFHVNCFPCHGDIAAPQYQPGPVSTNSKGAIPGIDISSTFYAEKDDGYLYATIHYGGLVIMPALGWKLSDTEHWDIVNYVRKVQSDKNSGKK